MNLIANEENYINYINNIYEDKIESHYKLNALLIFILVFGRVMTLDVFNILGDLRNVCMIYCTFLTKSKLEAVICFISAIICTVFAINSIVKSFTILQYKFYPIFSFSILVYSLITYLYLVVISYFAMIYYTRGCPCDQNNNQNNNQNINQISDQSNDKGEYSDYNINNESNVDNKLKKNDSFKHYNAINQDEDK